MPLAQPKAQHPHVLKSPLVRALAGWVPRRISLRGRRGLRLSAASQLMTSWIPAPRAGSLEPWSGPPSKCKRLADAGVSKLMCQHSAHDDLAFVELLAKELAPLV